MIRRLLAVPIALIAIVYITAYWVIKGSGKYCSTDTLEKIMSKITGENR